MGNLFQAANVVMPTTAAPVPVTTGTAIKTLLQLTPPSTKDFIITGWGINFDASASAAPIKVELIETDVAATVTAHVIAGITSLSGPGDQPSIADLGTAKTGYTASVEGATTASRMFDFQLVAPNGGYARDWPLGREPKLRAGKFLRVRVTAAVAVNAHCWITWEE